jgi:alanine racemase
MHRSELTVDLGAIRRNAATLLHALGGAELWAVVKANGYGHGALDAARAALDGGATALCVATVPEALALRAGLREPRILVLGPHASREVAEARDARLELVVADGEIPAGIPVHLELDSGMGRYGLAELPEPPVEVAGLMTHLATADSDPAFARAQLERFRAATEPYAHLTRHAANSAAALRLPEARFDAARCGVALYGSRRSAPTRRRTAWSQRSAGRATSRRSSGSSRVRARATAGASSRRRRPGSGSSRSGTATGSGGT